MSKSSFVHFSSITWRQVQESINRTEHGIIATFSATERKYCSQTKNVLKGVTNHAKLIRSGTVSGAGYFRSTVVEKPHIEEKVYVEISRFATVLPSRMWRCSHTEGKVYVEMSPFAPLLPSSMAGLEG